ncbi:restriction system-associated AAA family ATPase [Pedobacter roseus]|uniref:Restriction system-associated AAA family ATPase n=1 Tax=Pedobacter roseus TaxID=336820 RepID=A0A7G9QH79_9SPHI|nr:restriction system-associated AAA family ATPase [Pedobacter roseus]QNN42704.1 restriction system-associated AAA family ATPase [Pedobacter roseus]
MKIQGLKLFNNKYRGLEKFDKLFPKHILLKNHIDPICLVGLNGSGKSNFLELIADIFYDLEIFFLYERKNKLYIKDSPKYFAFANKNQDPLYFELRYKINVWNESSNQSEPCEVEISRHIPTGRNKKKPDPEFRIKIDEEYKVIDIDDARKYLPLIVGYTSGLNDLLSMPFIDLQDFYAQQVANVANVNSKSKLIDYGDQEIVSPNLMLLNYDSNAAIVVSNLMLADSTKLSTVKETLRISKLNTFRIVIRWNKLYTGKRLEVTKELQKYIKDLSDCAILKEIKRESANDEVHTLDFVCNTDTKELFKEKFESPQKLFEALTKLNLLNTLCIQKTQREKLRKKREKGQLIKFPQIATLDKIFSIEKIELVLCLNEDNLVRTEYEKISDGEHQFIHIIGGILLFDEKNPKRDILYLLDEPDTHFNPLWRSDFFYQLEEILENKDVEFILTTHSPFILSDCHGYNVFKFSREKDKVLFDRIKNETYGSTFENVLENIFHSEKEKDKHFNNQMAKLSFTRIEHIHTKIDSAVSIAELEIISKEIKLLGESIDRLEVLKHFSDKELELTKQ